MLLKHGLSCLGIPGWWGFSLVPTSHFAGITDVVTSSGFCGFGGSNCSVRILWQVIRPILETHELLLLFLFNAHRTRVCTCVCLSGCLQQSKEGVGSPEAGGYKHLG